MTNVDLQRLRRACGTRHGLIAPALAVPRCAADPPGVHHASVSDEGETADVRSAGGGVARSKDWAEVAALAEALERYAASVVALTTTQLPADPSSLTNMECGASGGPAVIGLDQWSLHSQQQRADPNFPYADGYPDIVAYTEAYTLTENAPILVPATLVALRRDYGALATSSGLAADFSPTKALLRAIQELVERDAYVTTWMHGLGGRARNHKPLETEVLALGGQLKVYDITPAYSPHPVACVAGSLPLRGVARNSLGLACRSLWQDAVEKAYLEFVQGTMFAGHKLRQFPQLEALTAETCTGFDEHALFWSVHHEDWWDLPLHQVENLGGILSGEESLRHSPPASNRSSEPRRPSGSLAASTPASERHTDQGTEWRAGRAPGLASRSTASELGLLANALADNKIRVFYRALPAAGLDQIGLHVVRALSPDLVPLHHNHNWPFLGGTASNWKWRYPDLYPQTDYPSPFPHALG